PSIYGLEDVKEGLLCQLFGGMNSSGHQAEQEERIGSELGTETEVVDGSATRSSIAGHLGSQSILQSQSTASVNKKKTHVAAGARRRAEINVLLVGDPSTAKSQLLRHVHRLAPRGVLTSGSGSSAVGLTAYVKRDEDTDYPPILLFSEAKILSPQFP
ncbi:MAG: putative DNA replication licensing factor mcm4, partial [Streblomastix strix]